MTALSHIRVLDLSTALAEPTGRVLADLGAEVIKIEPPGGCEARFVAPFANGAAAPDASLFWRAWGRDKKSVVLDIFADSDRAKFIELVRGADVLIESFTPGTLAAAGLAAPSLRQLNPSLVVVSVTPFGQTGPEASSPATDLTLAAAGGFLNCQGDRDRPPVPIGQPETSCSGAIQAAADALMALYEREHSGQGQHLDSSLQAAVLWTLLYVTGYGAWGQDAPGMADDRAHPASGLGLRIPVFAQTDDGFLGMTLVLGQPGARSFGRMMSWAIESGAIDSDLASIDWTQMFALLGKGELKPSDAQRAIDQLVAFFGTRTKREIHRRAVAGRWLVAPCWTTRDLLDDEQLAARGYWVDIDGTPYPGPFARLSETPIAYRAPAPTLGQHQHLVEPVRQPSVTGRPAQPRRGSLFEGLKVADFAWVGAGPLVSKDLANLGATVIHVESEKAIDPLRIIPPFKDGIPNHSTGYCSANFNQSKLGLALDLAAPGARGVIDRMIDWADVLVESFVPGTGERFGLDYASVRARRPDIIMLSSCIRGQSGPERQYTGFGLQGAALAGFAAITGWPDRLPAGPFAAYSDFIAPRFSQAAIAAALIHRHRTGIGQYIDLAQSEAAIHFLAPAILECATNGTVPGLPGAVSARACPHGAFATAGTERYVAIAVETTEQWTALQAELSQLAKFDAHHTHAARVGARDAIEAALAEACSKEDAFALAERLRRAGVPAYPVLRASELHRDAQLRHREFFIDLDHPRIGPLAYDGPVTRFSDTPHRPIHAGPTIGQHSEKVLRDLLGYSDTEVSDLAAAGALT